MTVQSPKSRFLPTLTEVVHIGNPQPQSQREPEPPQSSVEENLSILAITPGLETELREQLHAMLNAQLQQLVPQLHVLIDTAVKQAVSNAVSQSQTGNR